MKHRTFSANDQTAFAELSGDYNPIHVDAVAARRLLYGAPVVHGIHALLWGLNCCLQDRTTVAEIRSLKTVFTLPMKVGDEVGLSIQSDDGGRIRFELLSGRSVAARVDIELGESTQERSECVAPSFPPKSNPRELPDEQIETDSGKLELFLNGDVAGKMFPHLMRFIPHVQISAIIATTRLVGATCPGLHSIYSELQLTTCRESDTTTLDYEVTTFDSRFHLLMMTVRAPQLTGSIKAFRRPVAQEQAGCSALARHVENDEFVGQHALIVGGSRGIGEVAAKLLSAGGAEVMISYHRGKDDAQRIVDDIVSNGGKADSFQFDVLNPNIQSAKPPIGNWGPTHLYYFATPFIFQGVKGQFSAELFRHFCEHYVTGFIYTVDQARECGISHIFCPSSVAVDEVPSNMGEYSAAKSASEIVCTFLEKSHRGMTVYKPRFPRVATDQTASLIPVANEDPAPIMLKELRTFRDLANAK